ncbi:Glutaminase [Pseudonocardia sp. Ae406_Ps2]|uniref:glutaminase A n=1 Tax=unclassified Pseudonocardia TaxID=2619320 RepID=UPI00094B5681|nr:MULTISPECIES: glutaminase A [unclassified Pseudonocardia]OLM00855.1 Glutaminase [Pseudonocardia sp. Ae406_Ps2]OLM07354.1 Glutaminase [Pseudonocardia sp. Ae331_Ps2]OLM14542.1 Glutaminase [Pseudonocardia sp. Ae505_Ps2]OLM22433.1 Glutaminase [Pseudonocardia sp. Ae706_Ps2]OLM31700.1 Glutaminase [Pseudonocardia sp. Ae717_Ps2]
MVAQAERELVQQQFEELRSTCTAGSGILLPGEEVVSYYPPEMEARAEEFGLAGTNVDGTQWQVGDCEVRFPLHSISKVFTYGLALEDNGLAETLRRIGVEPSGDPFNSITFDHVHHRPFNPMINAGALVAANMVQGATKEERAGRLLERNRVYTGNPSLEIDQDVLDEQLVSNDRNLGLSYLMRSLGMLHGDIDDTLYVYLAACSITVTAPELSVMGATLAHGGVNPLTGERALSREHLRTVISVMSMCGMYDAAGEWAHDVGIPAKSGVSGGIMGVLPRWFGLGVYSPGLDRHGNSVRGVAVCRELSSRFGLHVFADPQESRFGRIAQPD